MDPVTVGGTLSLLAALSWAIGTVLIKKQLHAISPTQVNLFKTSFALPLFLATGWLLSTPSTVSLGGSAILWLTLSGIAGLAAGDTFLFTALRDLGAQRTMLLQATSPVIATLVAVVWPGEALGVIQGVGILITMVGVAWVIGRPRGGPAEPLVMRGVLCGLTSATFNALGIVMSRHALVLVRSAPELRDQLAGTAWAVSVRLAAAVVVLLFLARYRRRAEERAGIARRRLPWRALALPSFIGTYLGLMMVMLGLVFAPSGIVAALSSTTPLFLLPLGVWFLGERLRASAVTGTIIAMLGMALIFLSDRLTAG
ncbi:MAG: DMT family transporter [Planctomycetota bacterium]